MKLDIKIPSVGESVKEAILAQWYKKSGDRVRKDEPILVIETDKVTLEIVAEADGILTINVPMGQMVAIGSVVGFIETDITEKPPILPEKPIEKKPQILPETSPKPEVKPVQTDTEKPVYYPSVRRLAAQYQIDLKQIKGSGPGGRITKGDVILYQELKQTVTVPPAQIKPQAEQPQKPETDTSGVTRKPMSPIRKRIAERLVQAKQTTAMLTTFNEIDMSRIMAIRDQFKDAFKEKHGVNLGFMSVFIKACVEALKEFPAINAFIDGTDIIYHDYYHIGVAVGSEKGLVVPVIRHAEKLSFAQIEQAIVDFVKKIKENRLEISDLEGGTFTITNGGVFGSLLSTPILNVPQSGILGMHKIEKRPVVVDDQIVIRPMMYVALSYDHRIVDGREAVTFLRRIKENVETPERMMMEI